MADSSEGLASLAGPYASALFAIAEERDALERTEQGLESVLALTAGSADLGRLIRSPVVARADQGRAMSAIRDAMGSDPLVRNFVGVLARNRRLGALPAIVRRFRALAAERRGEVEAVAETAIDLDDATTGRIRDALADALGRRVALRTEVDRELLGGLVVRVGSIRVDGSLRTQLQSLAHVMKGAA
ncbi:MAG: F0F1 ATP synthase subunit delta [Rhodospirillales bacterium]|nr:F0F1 ATP synthase subunit delta [Rhodospirillales bacterium]